MHLAPCPGHLLCALPVCPSLLRCLPPIANSSDSVSCREHDNVPPSNPKLSAPAKLLSCACGGMKWIPDRRVALFYFLGACVLTTEVSLLPGVHSIILLLRTQCPSWPALSYENAAWHTPCAAHSMPAHPSWRHGMADGERAHAGLHIQCFG